MSNEDQLKQIDITIEQAQKAIDLQAAFKRLLTNKDFEAVITKGYFENEAVRLVLTKADPSMDTPEKQASLLKSIDSIGILRQYFVALNHGGYQALKAKTEHEEAREEILAEDLGAK